MRLKDTYDRPVSNLRISLTPACNLHCIYCHAEGEKNPQDSSFPYRTDRDHEGRCKV